MKREINQISWISDRSINSKLDMYFSNVAEFIKSVCYCLTLEFLKLIHDFKPSYISL